MNVDSLSHIASRLFFGVSFLMLALAVIEKLSNLAGYTILRDTYVPGRLLEFAAVFLLFVIAILLRQVREALRKT